MADPQMVSLPHGAEVHDLTQGPLDGLDGQVPAIGARCPLSPLCPLPLKSHLSLPGTPLHDPCLIPLPSCLEGACLLLLHSRKLGQVDHHTAQRRRGLRAPVGLQHCQDDALLLEGPERRGDRAARRRLGGWWPMGA